MILIIVARTHITAKKLYMTLRVCLTISCLLYRPIPEAANAAVKARKVMNLIYPRVKEYAKETIARTM